MNERDGSVELAPHRGDGLGFIKAHLEVGQHDSAHAGTGGQCADGWTVQVGRVCGDWARPEGDLGEQDVAPFDEGGQIFGSAAIAAETSPGPLPAATRNP